MGRTAPYRDHLWGPVQGANELPYVPGNRASENAYLVRELHRPEMRRWFGELDSVPTRLCEAGVWDSKHRPIVYAPSQRAAIHLVSMLLGVPLTEAFERVRSDRTLRSAAGYQRATKKTLRKLAKRRAANHRKIKHDAFPCYETVRKFPGWLANAERKLACAADSDLDHRDADPYPGLRELAHRRIPAIAAIRYGIAHSLVAVDGAGVRSPLRRHGRVRKDGAARRWKKRSKRWHGRLRMTVITGPHGLVIHSEYAPRTEHEAMTTRVVAQSRQNLNAIATLCAEAGASAPTIERPLWFGDGAFNTVDCMRELHQHSFDGLFRSDHDGIRKITGEKTLRTPEGVNLHVKVCNDGVHLCSCQWRRLPKDVLGTLDSEHLKAVAQLEPMEQLAGRHGEYVMMRCVAPTCPRFKQEIRVPYPRLSDGTVNLAAINQVVRWDSQNVANLFMATQAIERHNAQLSRAKDTDRKVIPALTRQLGDDAADFAGLLADLRRNLQILRSLELDRVKLETPDLHATLDRAHKKATQARKLSKPGAPLGPAPKYHLMDGAAKRLQAGRPPTTSVSPPANPIELAA